MVSNLALGIQLTIVGMALVFLLLALLWVLITLLLRLDHRPRSVGACEAGSRGAGVQRSGGDEVIIAEPLIPPVPHLTGSSSPQAQLPPEMLAAVMVAVRMHRRIRRKQAAPAMRSHRPGTLPSRWIGAGRVSQNQSWHPGRR